MVEPPLRCPPAVEPLLRRRSNGPAQRIWLAWANSAIGIEARMGRDSLARLGTEYESPAPAGGSPITGAPPAVGGIVEVSEPVSF